MAITATERAEVDRANRAAPRRSCSCTGCGCCRGAGSPGATGRGPGFVTLAPGWPDDPATVEAARAHPETFAGKSVGAVTDHYAKVIRALDRKPVVMGHSFGGLITQKLAGQGLARPPWRSTRALPRRAAAAGLGPQGVLGRARQPGELPARRDAHREAVPVRLRQRRLRPRSPTTSTAGSPSPRPAAAVPAATANINPRTEAGVDTRRTDRGPLLIVSGERDNTVPWAIANASYKKQVRNADPTEITEIAGRATPWSSTTAGPRSRRPRSRSSPSTPSPPPDLGHPAG